MTRKPNFWKLILGLTVIATLFVVTWATTRTPQPSTTRAAAVGEKAAPTSLKASSLMEAIKSPSGASIFDSFELDGDIVETVAGAPDDWVTVNCTNTDHADVKTGVLFDGRGPTVFATGSKDDLDVTGWAHKTDQNSPPKDEILNAYAAKYTAANGDSILAFGADKYDTSGTAFIGAWFFRNSVVAAEDGRFRTGPLATDPLAVHTVGDVLILLNFPQGGSNFAVKQVFEWVGPGGTCVAPNTIVNGVLCNITGSGQADSVEGISNLSAGPQVIPGTCSAWVHDPKNGPDGTIQTNAFFEGAINISDFPALGDACFSSFLLETRSSDSVSATLKDFVLGEFNTCPEISITKTADDTSVCVGTPTTYTYVVNNPTALALTGTVVDDNETPGNPADDLDVTALCVSIGVGTPQTVSLPPGNTTFTCSRTLGVGTHTNIVTVVASFGGFSDTATDDETVTVTPTPKISIDVLVCSPPQTGFQLTATPSGGTAPYNITFDGESCTSCTSKTISRTVGGAFTATVTDANGCTAQWTRNVGYCSDSANPQ